MKKETTNRVSNSEIKLQERIEELELLVAEMKAENIKLKKKIAQLQAENLSLQNENTLLLEENKLCVEHNKNLQSMSADEIDKYYQEKMNVTKNINKKTKKRGG